MLEKVLFGCPNLESLELHNVLSILRLEISSLKLTSLSIKDYQNENHDLCLEIVAPHIKYLQLLGYCDKIRLNVASLISAILSITFDDLEDEDWNSEEECSYLKELLRSVAHVENLELGPWCIECLSILGLNGWQSPPSSRKFLKFDTALEQSDFPGICSFLQSSPDLETLTIWYNHRPRDLLIATFEDHQFSCSLLYLKTINFIDIHESLSRYEFVVPFVKYLLKNATVLEKFVIAAEFKGGHVSQDYVKMTQEIQSFPISSPHASVVFSF
ncbi:hypothetical protein K7X08_029111 [Anisodus acutangulus]|uniref:FBD domain-containing protein n=1 Tax=Anisodus acutangulus TaxID=402998 RepID=A0A9Q1L3Q2_9SOLA|nr:hypothetical protein K7X08_029111 [Anisodus acutangulus]